MLTILGISLIIIGLLSFILKLVLKPNKLIDWFNKKRSLQITIIGLIMSAFTGMFFYADAGTAYAVQYVTGGDKMITTQGVKLKWWGRIIPLSYETSIKDITMVI